LDYSVTAVTTTMNDDYIDSNKPHFYREKSGQYHNAFIAFSGVFIATEQIFVPMHRMQLKQLQPQIKHLTIYHCIL